MDVTRTDAAKTASVQRRDVVRHLLETRWDFIALGEAKAQWAAHRAAHGAAELCAPLLTAPGDNAKLNKTEKHGNVVFSLSLAQSDTSGHNTCRFSTPDCRRGCVSFAGKGELDSVQAGRIRRTTFLVDNPSAFFTLLFHEIERAWAKYGRALSVRLNTFSDIPWERVAPELFERFPAVTFYDYTKWATRADLPPNYTLTYSVSEFTADSSVLLNTSHGENVAVIFNTKRGQDLPVKFMGVRVVDGDESDHRPSDPRGVIVGLRAKGRMRDGTYDMVRAA